MSDLRIARDPLPQRIQAGFRRFWRWLTSARVILSLVMLAVMIYLVIVPLYRMLETTLTTGEKDLAYLPDGEVGQLTLFHWGRMLTGAISEVMTYVPLQHSIVISLGATLLAMVIGAGMAWMVVRTDMPGRKVINILATVPYIMPSWTIAQAWLVLFKNRTIGGVPGVLESVFNISPPDWLAYGPVPIIISSALHYYTFFFLFIAAALMSIDSSLEEAGELMGASRWRILRKITFPLVIPAILSGFIMTFSKLMGTFGGPNVLGLPVGYYTVSTMIRADMKLSNYGDGFVLAITLILISMTTIFLNQKVVGTRKSYETIGGRGFMAQQTKLRNWKYILTAIVVVFQVIIAFLPLLLLTWDTFMLQDGDYSLSNLTTAHWIGQSNPDINHGEVGILLNPKDLFRGVEHDPACVVYGLLHGRAGHHPGLCHCEGQGHAIGQAGRTDFLHPVCNPGHRLWGGLHLDVCETLRAHSGPVWHVCPAGDRFGGQTHSVFRAFGCVGHVAGRAGT